MSKARRDVLVSSAQVAKQYGGYTLQTALQLSSDERELLLAVATAEEQGTWERLEKMLGLTWDLRTLVAHGSGNATSEGTSTLPGSVTVPMLLALAPEFFANLAETYKKKYEASVQVSRIAGGDHVVDVGNLSTADAMAFFKNLTGLGNG